MRRDRSARSNAGNALRISPLAGVTLTVVTLVGIAAFAWPLLIVTHGDAGHSADSPWIFVLMLPALLLVASTQLSSGRLDAKAVALLGVLGGISALLRPLTGGVTGVQFMFFLLIPAGRVFGPGFGFLLGNVAMFASAILTGGGGPWLPFQMLAAGWIGLGAGLLPALGTGAGSTGAAGSTRLSRLELPMLAGYGFLASIGYGFVMNLWFWPFAQSNVGAAAAVAFVPGSPLQDNLHRWLVYSVTTGLTFDVPRALSTLIALLVLGKPVLLALRRASRRAAFGAAVQFPGVPA